MFPRWNSLVKWSGGYARLTMKLTVVVVRLAFYYGNPRAKIEEIV